MGYTSLLRTDCLKEMPTFNPFNTIMLILLKFYFPLYFFFSRYDKEGLMQMQCCLHVFFFLSLTFLCVCMPAHTCIAFKFIF